MRIKTFLKEASLKLKNNNIPNPDLDAELILSNIINQPREYILAHPEKTLSRRQIANYKLQISRLIKGEPLAYITGCKQFYGLDFKVNKYVLIPRPETELMVDETLGLLRNMLSSKISNAKASQRPAGPLRGLNIIDIGTGSGCIIISVVKKLKAIIKEKGLSREASRLSPFSFSFKFFATDISKPALTVARQNAKSHNVDENIKFFHGNLLEPIIKFKKIENLKSKILILANLPYLTPSDIKRSPTIQYEPRQALHGGPDGLKYYRQLFKQLKNMSCVTCYVLCEIDPSQTEKIKQLAQSELPKSRLKIKKDLRGQNRLFIIYPK